MHNRLSKLPSGSVVTEFFLLLILGLGAGCRRSPTDIEIQVRVTKRPDGWLHVHYDHARLRPRVVGYEGWWGESYGGNESGEPLIGTVFEVRQGRQVRGGVHFVFSAKWVDVRNATSLATHLRVILESGDIVEQEIRAGEEARVLMRPTSDTSTSIRTSTRTPP